MTLIVYKDGVLAADTGSTRNDSREEMNKLFAVENFRYKIVVGFSGQLDAVYHYYHRLRDRLAAWQDTDIIHRLRDARLTDEPSEVCGMAVVFNYDTGETEVYQFSNFAHNTGQGVWWPVTTGFEVIGADPATISAIAVNAAKPRAPAWDIVQIVASVNSSCDTQFGVDYYDSKNKTFYHKGNRK